MKNGENQPNSADFAFPAVAITGSRSIRNRDHVFALLDSRILLFLERAGPNFELHVHLGDAQGVDFLALEWARARGITFRTVFFASLEKMVHCFDAQPGEFAIAAADWSSDGPAAGPIRNAAMLKPCSDVGGIANCGGVHAVIAIPDPPARGTRNCMAQARASGIPVHWFDAGRGEWDVLAGNPRAVVVA